MTQFLTGLPCLKEYDHEIYLKHFANFFFAVALASVLGCASTSTQEGTGGYIDDSVITTKVKSAIFGESTLKSADISVETFKGVVQLSGFVTSQADIQRTEELARKVNGVTSIKNNLQVKGQQ